MYSHTVVFLHVLSAFVWVGGMIVIRVAVHPVMQSIEDPKIKLAKTLQIMERLFHLVIPFIAALLVTGLIMAISSQGHHGSMKSLFLSKEIIWMVMTVNFTWMYFKRRKAEKLFEMDDLPSAKSAVALIPNYLLPINIALGILALWLGLILRGL